MGTPAPLKRMVHSWHAARNRRRVLLLEDLRAGYVPSPKVASTAVRSLLCRRQAERFYPELLDLQGRELQDAVEKRIRVSVSTADAQRLAEDYFLFGFVRNPVTRLYSCYLDKVVAARKKGRISPLQPFGVSADMSFDDFAECIADIPDSRSEKHFRSQHHLFWHGGRWLVSYVGRFESLDQEWSVLAKRFGLDISPKRRRSSGAGIELHQLPLGARSARRVTERYRRDIELFGYAEQIEDWLSTLPE